MTQSQPSSKGIPACFVDDSLRTRLLPVALSVVAGSTDAISFLGLGGLFTAHVTGNLVILVTHLVARGEAQIAPTLSVPVFMIALGAASYFAGKLAANGFAPLEPLLSLQFLLLAGSLALCVTAVRPLDPDSSRAVVAGMFGVSAMAVQNTLVQLSLKGAPSTAVMTTNITRLVVDLSEILLGRNPDGIVEAHDRAMRTWLAIMGFAAGCGLGAACESAIGLWSLALPTGLAFLSCAMTRTQRSGSPQ